MTSHIVEKVKPLAARLIHNFLAGDYDQRRESAIALSKFKGEKATDFLLVTYESDNIQDFLALALGNIDNEKAVGMLINALNDSQQEVRFNAARALGMIENPEAFNILMEAMSDYIDSTSEEKPKDEEDPDVEPAIQIFFEEDAIISAILALGKIKNWRAISLLKKLLAQEKCARIRASIIMALGMMSSDKLMPVFQSALRDEDPRVRANAIEAIECIKSGSIVGIIQPYLEDPSNRVRANVAKAIWKYGDFDVSDTLRQMLGHQDKWYRASAAYSIGEIKDARFIRELAKALKDEDSDVRRNAANALRKIEYKDAFPHLKPMLDDPNFDVKVEASLALSRCNPEEAPAILAEKLEKEENFIVQATLISCLGNSGQNQYSELIAGHLDSEDPRVVSNSIEALGKLMPETSPELAEKFKQLLNHEDNRVQSTAIKCLWVWGEYSALDNLKTLFNSDIKRDVQSATFVFGEIGSEISNMPELAENVNNIIAELIDNPTMINELLGIPESASTEAPAAEQPQQTIEAVIAQEPGKETASQSLHHTIAVGNAILPDTSFAQEIEIANNFVANHNFSEGEKVFKQILGTNPQHLKALLGLANLYFQVKNHNAAAKLYISALQINPNLVKAHFNLGTIYYYARKHESAVNHLVKALSLYPKLLGAYLILAQIYEAANKPSESVKLLSRAVTLSPRNPVIYQKLAMLYISMEQYNKAVEVLKKGIEIAPIRVELNLMLAHCYNLISDHKSAFDAMDLTMRACIKSPNPDISLKKLLKAYLFLNSNKDQANKTGE